MASYLPGWAIYSFAYRGFAGSTGLPSDSRIKLDAQCIYFHVMSLHQGRIDRLAICGRSIGCSPATWLARDSSPSHLVLLSPFESLHHVIANLPAGKFLSRLLRHPMHVARYAHHVCASTLLLSAANDRLVPPEMTAKLLSSFRCSPRLEVIPGADHKSLPRSTLSQAAIARHLLEPAITTRLPVHQPDNRSPSIQND